MTTEPTTPQPGKLCVKCCAFVPDTECATHSCCTQAPDWKAIAEDQRIRARDLLVDIQRDALAVATEHRLRRRAETLVAEMDKLTTASPPSASTEKGVAVECVVCKRRKKPVGRDAGPNVSLCDGHDGCEGYRQEPHPGDLWPGETREQFGYGVASRPPARHAERYRSDPAHDHDFANDGTPFPPARGEVTDVRWLDLLSAARVAEAALADIGDADREPSDNLAWCEQRAAEALPAIRNAIKSAAALRASPQSDPVASSGTGGEAMGWYVNGPSYDAAFLSYSAAVKAATEKFGSTDECTFEPLYLRPSASPDREEP